MSREIKFRAWDVIEKRMRRVEEISFNKNGSIQGLYERKEGDRLHIGVTFDEYTSMGGFTEHVLLMQFTGLLDKNGKEIYEGDVLKTDDECCDSVVYKENKFILEPLGDDCVYWEQLEVIGNIYENPELVKP